jgi:hypothetical protein
VKLRHTRRPPLLEAQGFRLDVMFPTGSMEFDLPPGETVRQWEGRPAVPVRVMGVTAHAHRYVQWIQWDDVTTGERLWRFEPRTDFTGEVLVNPIKWFAFGLGKRLTPDHRYRITTLYRNPTGDTIPRGGMAKIAGGFRLAGVPLPPVDPSDSLFRQDLRYLLRERCGTTAAPGPSPVH